MPSTVLRPLPSSLLVACVLAQAAIAEPMSLQDAMPRWVGVRFEVSPASRPAQLDSIYTPWLRAWLEPDAEPGRIHVSIGGASIESTLLAAENPVPGSFGSFDWIFDAESGHVVSARLAGRLIKTVDWGVIRSRVSAEIRVAMSTRGAAGFEPPQRLFGQVMYGYCERPDAPACTLVDPVRYDAESGYVNAVGDLSVVFRGVSRRTFSPLGEAVFSEIPAPPDADPDPRVAQQQ